MKNKLYLIDEEALKELIEYSERLTALECAGVDNWSWYSEAFRDYLDDKGCDSFDQIVQDQIKQYDVYKGE